MKFKHFCIALLFIILPYLVGCGSGSYNIEKGDYKDTTQYKSTGLKLKNSYNILKMLNANLPAAPPKLRPKAIPSFSTK